MEKINVDSIDSMGSVASMGSMEITEKYHDEFKDVLSKLIAIPSVVSEAEGNMPFGADVNHALEFMLEIAEKDGFDIKNVDNYGGHIDFPGKNKDEIVAVVGHLDVVPCGDIENWNTNPFEMVEKDGKFYGRGVLDDKGPLLAAYYAIKALKDSGFKPNKTIRIILGCDEETEWNGMTYYMEKEKPNVVSGFSPDADFPAIHAEKGCAQFLIEKKISPHHSYGICIKSMKGGTVANAVADKAVAKLQYFSSQDDAMTLDDAYNKILASASSFVPSEGSNIEKFDGVDKLIDVDKGREQNTILLTAHGVSAHGSRPSLGLNAISLLMDFLGQLERERLLCSQSCDIVNFYNDKIGYFFDGSKMGIGFSDEPSGELSLNIGLVNWNEEKVSYTIDIRYPVTVDFQDVCNGLLEAVVPNEYRIQNLNHMKPLYKPVSDPLIETLMAAYKEFTGDLFGKPIVIGGGTYARAVPNTVAFGPVMPGREDICHQPNEYIHTEDLYMSIKIFARALYELSN